jgi:2-methylisocitrate lyase-like PEP mutase family enzyme
MLPDGVEVYVENASPRIGRKPNAVFPPDLEHIESVLEQVQPSVILACGRLAQTGLDKLGVNYVPAPHPAYRALSHEMTAEIRKKLEAVT